VRGFGIGSPHPGELIRGSPPLHGFTDGLRSAGAPATIHAGKPVDIDILNRSQRTVALGPHKQATYVGDGVWDVTLRAPGRANRSDGVLLTRHVLEQLSADNFEHDRAERIIDAFGDTP
jgi:hypothetical protein